MKVCVITVSDSSNCGSVLQAFAMKNLLMQYGCDVVFLRTRSKKYVKRLFYNNSMLIRGFLKYGFKAISRYRYGQEKYRLYQEADRQFSYIEKSNQEDIELYILGSDEIWNVKSIFSRLPVCFGVGLKNRVIALAVSAGSAQVDDFKMFPNLVEGIKNINEVYPRDRNTINIVKRITDNNPIKISDPTIAFNDWENVHGSFNDDYLDKNSCICVYAYNIPNPLKKLIIRYANTRGIKVVSIGFWMDWVDYNIQCSPMDLYHVLCKSKRIITTTFHGTIFSIIANKPLLISYELELSGKVSDLIDDYELKDRFFDWKIDNYEYFEKLMDSSMAYDHINSKIMESSKKAREIISAIFDSKQTSDK